MNNGLLICYVDCGEHHSFVGAFVGIKVGDHENNHKISKWIGFALLPQAGVAIGLVFQLSHYEELSNIKPLLINIILGSTIIYEILGPIASKFALIKSGDLKLS